jgi:L-threonylcarbamoyladenylate synthase
MPAHPVARTLLKTAALPVAAPSANTFTRPSATTAAHVLEDLKGRVDLILDAGPTTIGVESTVLDLTRTVPVVLRPGGVVLSDLRALIPDVQLAPRYLHNEAAPAPGQMLKHYSPRAQVLLFSGGRDAVLNAINVRLAELTAQGQRAGLLVADEDIDELSEAAAVESLGSIHDLPAISQKLFAGLRALDAVGVDFILTRDFGRQGLGAAIWDRLLRAAEGQVIAVE